MPYDKQLDLKFRHFQSRILELEKAAEAQDRAIMQLAEKMGVEVDLTHVPTTKEVSAQKQTKKSVDRALEDKEILALLKESEQDDAQ
jgi:predicted nuclease with RNAse H fold